MSTVIVARSLPKACPRCSQILCLRCTVEKELATHSSTLPGKFHRWRSLVGYSPWGHKDSDTTGRLHFLSIVPFGEGNGNPLQCSCLESPMDRGAWWATVYGVAKSRTRLSNKHTHSHTHVYSRVIQLCVCVCVCVYISYPVLAPTVCFMTGQ